MLRSHLWIAVLVGFVVVFVDCVEPASFYFPSGNEGGPNIYIMMTRGVTRPSVLRKET